MPTDEQMEAAYRRIMLRARSRRRCTVVGSPPTADGYGRVHVARGVTMLAHRVVWWHHHGPIAAGVEIRHAVCDNPPCVRIDHLRDGSHADNMADMVAHGRGRGPLHLVGEANPRARLSAADVSTIRLLYLTTGVTARQLAARFGVTRQAVNQIISRAVWRHVA